MELMVDIVEEESGEFKTRQQKLSQMKQREEKNEM